MARVGTQCQRKKKPALFTDYTDIKTPGQTQLFKYKISKFVTVISFLITINLHFITNRFNIQRFYFLLAQRTYVNSMYLRTTSDVCPL